VKASLFSNSAALDLIALALGSFLVGQPYPRAHDKYSCADACYARAQAEHSRSDTGDSTNLKRIPELHSKVTRRFHGLYGANLAVPNAAGSYYNAKDRVVPSAKLSKFNVQYGIPSASIANTNFDAITGTAVWYLARNIQVSWRYQH
jgi:hypothetical protein